MKIHFCLLIYFSLQLFFVSAQKKDTNVVTLAGQSGNIITKGKFRKGHNTGAIKEYPLPENEKKKLLKDFVSKLNGYWKSDSGSYITKFILSNKNFKGQSIVVEEIQQVGPVLIKLDITDFGKIKLISNYTHQIQSDTSDIYIIDNKLIINKSTYLRHKK